MRRSVGRAVLAVLVLAVAPVVACAAVPGLVWEQARIALAPPAGTSEASALFKFTNRSAAAVRLLEVRSSCGCTVATPDREVYQPGESGVIPAHFVAGEREGPQSVAITVFTDEGPAEPYVLTLEVTIELPVRARPRFVHWSVGENVAAKSVHLQVLPGWILEAARADSDAFGVDLVRHDSGGIELRVTPRDTWAKRDGRIKLTLRRGDAAPVEYLVWARVM